MSVKAINASDLLERISTAAQTVPPPTFGQTGATFIHLMGGIPKIDIFNELLSAAGIAGEVSKTSIAESKGLLVSNDDLQNIFSYVYSALKLPKTVADAEEYIGIQSNDDFFRVEKHKFLAPEKQVEFNAPIREHASLWANLEQSIKNTGNSLNIYSREFVSQAEDIIEVLTDLNQYLKVKGFVDKDGKDIVECGTEILQNWKKNTEKHGETSKALYEKLVSFHDKLNNEISQSVTMRSNKVAEMELTTEQADLQIEADGLAEELKRIQKTYEDFKKASYVGCAPILPFAVAGGFLSAKAEEAREKRNKLRAELDVVQQKLDAINRAVGGVNRLQSSLIDFSTSITAAIIGLQHVNTVWDSVIQEIDGAINHINKMDDPEYATWVKSLRTEIKLAKDNWKSCGDITKELVATFDRARADFDGKPVSYF